MDKALEFLKDWELDEAHTKLLTELGRVLEAAAIYAKKGDLVKAVETLSASATHHVDHAQQILQYLLTGLRRSFTLGITITQTTSSTISRLLVLADQLHKSAEMKQGFDEVRSSHSFSGRIFQPYASSLQCFKQLETTTMQPSACSPRHSSGQEMTSLLCCA